MCFPDRSENTPVRKNIGQKENRVGGAQAQRQIPIILHGFIMESTRAKVVAPTPPYASQEKVMFSAIPISILSSLKNCSRVLK